MNTFSTAKSAKETSVFRHKSVFFLPPAYWTGNALKEHFFIAKIIYKS